MLWSTGFLDHFRLQTLSSVSVLVELRSGKPGGGWRPVLWQLRPALLPLKLSTPEVEYEVTLFFRL